MPERLSAGCDQLKAMLGLFDQTPGVWVALAAGWSGGFSQYSHVWSYALFKLLGDVIELGIKRAADRIDACDDHNRNAGGDQAIFDGGSARLVFEERKKGMHLR